jgi:hypothetical protein
VEVFWKIVVEDLHDGYILQAASAFFWLLLGFTAFTQAPVNRNMHARAMNIE